MSDRDWKIFIKDIYSAIEKILKYTKDIIIDQLEKDDKTFDAVMRNEES